MKKIVGFILFVALLLVIGGGIIIFVGAKNGDFKASGGKTITNNYDIEEEFNEINVSIDITAVEFKKADDGKCKVECVEKEKIQHKVEVKDGKLTIEAEDNRKPLEKFFMFNNNKLKVTVYLSADNTYNLKLEGHTGSVTLSKDLKFNDVDVKLSTASIDSSATINNNLKIEVSTGSIHIENTNPQSADLKVSTGNMNVKNLNVAGAFNCKTSTGDIKFEDVNANSLSIKGTTSEIILKNTIVAGHLKIEVSTGDVRLDHCDADTIRIDTSTGDVKGTILSAKSFIVHTDTGRCNVPKTTGNLCEIETDTGNIDIELA
ncbi:MAG: DUF4097 domain-containing protein [Bacilli bacterium]|nr:DUF4097 domain-containing protein [Bacilli bacterium]